MNRVDDAPMRLVIVSGLSGSGKSVALNLLEDLDFYCMDNVPAALLDTLVTEIFATRDSNYANLALGVDARNRPRDLRVVRHRESLQSLLQVAFGRPEPGVHAQSPPRRRLSRARRTGPRHRSTRSSIKVSN